MSEHLGGLVSMEDIIESMGVRMAAVRAQAVKDVQLVYRNYAQVINRFAHTATLVGGQVFRTQMVPPGGKDAMWFVCIEVPVPAVELDEEGRSRPAYTDRAFYMLVPDILPLFSHLPEGKVEVQSGD